MFPEKGDIMRRLLMPAKSRLDENSESSSILDSLPDSPSPELGPDDRLVVLLASAAQEGGRLSPASWKKASDIFSDVFAPRDLES